MAAPSRQPIKIAIVGGGFGGLSFAHTLAKFIPNWESFIQIDVYEATSSLLAQVGTGIGVWPLVWGILEELGLLEELMQYTLDKPINEPTPLLRLRRADRPVGQDLFRMVASGNILFFHRGDFQAILLKHLPPSIKIHTEKRLKSYTQDESGVVLQFEDGTTAKSDIVIGADGVRSPVRKTMIEEIAGGPIAADPHPADPTWTGLVTYRTLIPREKLVAQGWENHRALSSWTVYTGKGAAMMAYPVSNGANVNFIGFRLWPEFEGTQFREEVMTEILRQEGYERPQVVEAKAANHKNVAANDVWSMEGAQGSSGKRVRWFSRVSPEEVRHAYGSWEPEVQALVNGIESPICWAVHGVSKLKTWTHKKVALLGDSAHAMPPQQGVGGSSAICDGYVLANLFAHAIRTDPSKLNEKAEIILDIYDKIRRPIADSVADASRACCRHFNRSVREEEDGQEVWRTMDSDKEEDMKRLQDELTNGWCYAWDRTSVRESADRAIEMLREVY